MEDNKKNTEGKGKISTYVSWIFVTVFGLFILFTMIMVVYRNFVS